MGVRLRNHPGDLLRALDYLKQDDPGVLRRVAEMLGFEWREAAVPRREVKAPSPKQPESSPEPESETAPDIDWEQNDAWVQPLEPAASQGLPDWYAKVETFPQTSTDDLPELKLPPLLAPGRTRAILGAAVAREVRDGDLDAERVAERLAEGEPLRRLPRLPRLRFDKGTQVLVDVHEAMRPYAGDQDQLVRALEALLPRDLLEIVDYPGCPLQQDDEHAYRPPRPGATALVLSDLGVGPHPRGSRRSSPRLWCRFGQMLRRRGCGVAAFVPCEPERVPSELRRVIVVLRWCPETTSGQVRCLRAPLDQVRYTG